MLGAFQIILFQHGLLGAANVPPPGSSQSHHVFYLQSLRLAVTLSLLRLGPSPLLPLLQRQCQKSLQIKRKGQTIRAPSAISIAQLEASHWPSTITDPTTKTLSQPGQETGGQSLNSGLQAQGGSLLRRQWPLPWEPPTPSLESSWDS